MSRQLTVILAIIGLTCGLPTPDASDNQRPNDFLSALNVPLERLSSILMSPHLDIQSQGSNDVSLSTNTGLESTGSHLFSGQLSGDSGIQTSHLLEVSKDSAIGAAKLPLEVTAEAKAVGSGIPAAAAVKGTLVGSAVATPIILKAVALPGVAAAKTAGLMTVPNVIIQNLKNVPEFMTNRLKTVQEFVSHNSLAENFKSSFDNTANNLDGLVVIPNIPTEVEMEEDTEKLSNAGSLLLNKTSGHLSSTVSAVKAGAVGLKAGVMAAKAGAVALAAKPFILAKKVAYVAGRAILKPVAIITGAHLKVIGSGLTLAGKLIGGTGAGVAKAGTAVKYAGLGGIGVGASAVAWGFDKSTLTAHQGVDSEVSFNTNTNIKSEN